MKNGLIISRNGTKLYYLNDKYHREDGPALEYSDGSRYYFANGKLHREDGPAIEYPNGNKSYWINDIVFYEQDYWKEIERRKSLKFILSSIKKELSK
jgi:hypothetical protein